MEFNKDYWTERYKNNQTGWDIGYASPALVEYAQTLPKENKILIPGAGNGYEAIELWQKGFSQVTVLDISEVPLQNIKKRCPDFPESQLILRDFFEHGKKYDCILEQTFFCALNPVLRPDYAKKIHSLLEEKGILAGVLFNCQFENPGPPFGGNSSEYKKVFADYFEFLHFEPCHNSINPRSGKELFIEFRKK